MRLTRKDHPETIRRYQHLRKAGWGKPRCGARWPEEGRACARERDHRRPHAAYAGMGRVVAVWDAGGASESSGFTPLEVKSARPTASQGRRRAARPVGLRDTSPNWLASLGRRVLRMVLDIEELALFLMFLAFVYFAIDWLKIIFR